jgi:hydrogenase maturation protease
MAAGRPTVRVIGLGNAYRGDDAIGLEVAREVGRRMPEIDTVAGVADGTMLLDLWTEADLCIIVDCAVSGQAAGTIHRFDGLQQRIPAGLFSSFSTHAYSIPGAIELGKALGRLPRRLVVYAIEGATFGCGARIATAVLEAAENVIAQIEAEIRMHQQRNDHAKSRPA